MAKKKNSEKHWRDILNRQARSGLSIREFCAKAGVSQPSFYTWRRKFRERAGENGESGMPRFPAETSGNGGPFIPLRLVDSASALEVIHPLGYRVRVTGEMNIHDLRQVLEVLDGRRDR